MTTSKSPLRQLKGQADDIARRLKALERGEGAIVSDPAGRIEAAQGRETITFGIVMDDKLIKIEIAWATIRAHSEAGLAEFVLKHMRGQRDNA